MQMFSDSLNANPTLIHFDARDNPGLMKETYDNMMTKIMRNMKKF